MSNTVYGIRLNPRQAWVWHRLGNQQTRNWLAPDGVCVECVSHPAQPATRNGWFCYVCQDSLDQRKLLPEEATQVLQTQNQLLRMEIQKLRTKLKTTEKHPNLTIQQQLPLFLPES